MWKCCSQPHHCITNLGIELLHRFFGALLDGVQFFHQSVFIRHNPKVIVKLSNQLSQVHVGSMGHNVQCHIPFNGLVHAIGMISSSVQPLRWKKPMVFFHISYSHSVHETG